MMVPNGWYPGYANPASQAMVQEYVAKYGGTPSDVNADVAEAYSVGQVMAQAVTSTGGTDNAKIITYLHSGVTITTVQGPVKFDSLGKNSCRGGVHLPVAGQRHHVQAGPPARRGRLGGDHQPQAELD